MKYIVFQDNSAIIFADSMNHSYIANGRPVRSAGFCQIETYRNKFDDVCAKISCFGESTTLKVKADPNDNQILESIWR